MQFKSLDWHLQLNYTPNWSGIHIKQVIYSWHCVKCIYELTQESVADSLELVKTRVYNLQHQ